MTYSFPTHLKQFSKNLFEIPISLFIVQIPQVFLVALQWYTERKMETSPFLQFAINYPIYCVVTVFCSCMTYSLIKRRSLGLASGIGNAIGSLFPPMIALILSSLLVGLVLIAGFSLLVAPGIYLMALYLFVPYLIMERPEESVMKALYRSTTITKGNLKVCLITAFVTTLITFGVYLTSQAFSEKFVEPSVLPFLIEAGSTILCAITLDAWLANLYLVLKHE